MSPRVRPLLHASGGACHMIPCLARPLVAVDALVFEGGLARILACTAPHTMGGMVDMG
eukprot:CAMPEP_0198500820 /NCGR_PEP_ID=MMETSP1462-20131121/8362_1 /TAXON_ID=1333877 /ORGANISM="Brandtodinium nutriculum, Strain RCC3387" /LENGTH=57 /DNA_ID=CAMNT_0044229839 /DNA_START=199 /DNA_END=368 /DNA_ORIENTATION=+